VDEKDLVAEIGRLTNEEHRLEQAHAGESGGLSQDEVERLKKLEVALDQCWDLLRQRRARLEFGRDPEGAQIRPPDVVEDYRQ
jgi:hypothetical protein